MLNLLAAIIVANPTSWFIYHARVGIDAEIEVRENAEKAAENATAK